MLTVCDNISMKNVIKRVKSVKLLNFKLLNRLNKCTGTLTIMEVLITLNVTLLSTVNKND